MSIVKTTQALSKAVTRMSKDIEHALTSGADPKKRTLTKIAVTGQNASKTLHNLGPNTYRTHARGTYENLTVHLDATNRSLSDALENLGVDAQATLESLRQASEPAKQASIGAKQLSNLAPYFR